MLDAKTAKLLEDKVFEMLDIDQLKNTGSDSLAKMIYKFAVRATITTLQEYEKLNNGYSEN